MCVDAGSVAEGQPCHTFGLLAPFDDCGPGLKCYGDTTPTLRCRRYCNWADAGCPSGEWCSRLDFIEMDHFALLCMPRVCDPLTQDCPGATYCYTTFGGGTACASPGAITDGGACFNDTDCAAGSGCQLEVDEGYCQRYCNLDAGDPACVPPLTCVSYMNTIGFTPAGGDVGVCE